MQRQQGLLGGLLPGLRDALYVLLRVLRHVDLLERGVRRRGLPDRRRRLHLLGPVLRRPHLHGQRLFQRRLSGLGSVLLLVGAMLRSAHLLRRLLQIVGQLANADARAGNALPRACAACGCSAK